MTKPKKKVIRQKDITPEVDGDGALTPFDCIPVIEREKRITDFHEDKTRSKHDHAINQMEGVSPVEERARRMLLISQGKRVRRRRRKRRTQ